MIFALNRIMEHIRDEIDLVKETVKQESEKVGFARLVFIYLSFYLFIYYLSTFTLDMVAQNCIKKF